MCPDCKEPLVIFELEGIEIDRCLACSGTWLDAGEIELIVERAGLDAGELRRALDALTDGGRGKGRCPRCRRRLRKSVLPGPASGAAQARPADLPLELDRCPRRHGLWLDAGEVETAVRVYTHGPAGAVMRFFSELYRAELQLKPKGD
jgi:Zn-finger nucleic acid-binding protein